MRIKKILPRILKNEIKYIYVFEGAEEMDYGDHMHLPDGTFDLVFSFGKPMKRTDQGMSFELPDVRIAGGYTKGFTLTYPKEFTVVAFVFHPIHVSRFIPDIFDIASEKCVKAEAVFGQKVLEFSEIIENSNEIEKVVLNIEKFLLTQRSGSGNYHEDQINFALRLMDYGASSVSTIGREIGMSDRNFRRVFKDLTGFTPQKMLRLKRVKRLSRMLNKAGELNNAVASLGYYDVSHMIHDFKSITNVTPHQYATNLDRIDEAFHYWK